MVMRESVIGLDPSSSSAPPLTMTNIMATCEGVPFGRLDLLQEPVLSVRESSLRKRFLPSQRRSSKRVSTSIYETSLVWKLLRENRLYFYCANKGRIISSGKCENYTTFQELIDPPRGIIDRAQLSDAWFVEKLQLHYYLLNRQQQSFLWDLVSMKTIGFASFIRVCILSPHPGLASDTIGKFERTVPRDQDPTGYIVTAKIPAIVAESQAESQFQYSLKHPLKTSKMMLYNLDCLAGTTNPRRPGFYVVEIKEAPATG